MPANALVSACTPTFWTPMNGEFKLQPLSEWSNEYCSVAKKIKSSLDVELNSVVRVQNPFLWGCYEFKKLEYQARRIHTTEMELFHCTSAANIQSIACNNLDWRRTFRSKFGQGVSFSPRASYANKYANFDIGTERAMILAHVLVGRKTCGGEKMKIPPESYDTSIGQWFGKQNNTINVYVKYYDYEFYPSYVAYYHCSPPRSKQSSNHSSQAYEAVTQAVSRQEPIRYPYNHTVQPTIQVERRTFSQIQYPTQGYTIPNTRVQSERYNTRPYVYQHGSNFSKVNNSNDSWCSIL